MSLYEIGTCSYCNESNQILRPSPFMADAKAMMCEHCWNETEEEYKASHSEYIPDFDSNKTEYDNLKSSLEIPKVQQKVIDIILKERERQDKKWGEQNHAPQFWTGILGEEFGEFCEAVNETVFDNGSDKGGYENMKTEAIHVAAVAIGFLECLERNKDKWFK